jgi:hypothetical protein
MWEPRRLTTLWAFTACYSDSFTFYLTVSRYLKCSPIKVSYHKQFTLSLFFILILFCLFIFCLFCTYKLLDKFIFWHEETFFLGLFLLSPTIEYHSTNTILIQVNQFQLPYTPWSILMAYSGDKLKSSRHKKLFILAQFDWKIHLYQYKIYFHSNETNNFLV